MAREWTQKHIEELIKQVAIEEGYAGGGTMDEMLEAVMNEFVYGANRGIFVAGAGANPSGQITRLSRDTYRLLVTMGYGSVSAGETLIFISDVAPVAVRMNSPLFFPSWRTFLLPGYVIEEDYGSFDRSDFTSALRGVNSGSLQGNNIRGSALKTTSQSGLYIEATRDLTFNNSTPFKLDITIKYP